MTNQNSTNRVCKRGHNLNDVGVAKNRACKLCKRVTDARYFRRYNNTPSRQYRNFRTYLIRRIIYKERQLETLLNEQENAG